MECVSYSLFMPILTSGFKRQASGSRLIWSAIVHPTCRKMLSNKVWEAYHNYDLYKIQ